PLTTLLSGIVAQCGADGGALALAYETSLVCVASSGIGPEVGTIVNQSAGLSGACIRTGEVIYCSDTQTDPRVNAAVTQSMNIRSVLVVPLTAQEGATGLLQLLASTPSKLAPPEALPII